MVDDADPVDRGQFELEGGAGYFRDPACRHWDIPLGLTYGALPAVELGIGFGQQFERRAEVVEATGDEAHVHENGLGDLAVAAKWQCAGEGAWLPRQALAPSVKFPTADEDKGLGSGETDYDLTWIASKALTERLGVHGSVGYSWIGSPDGTDGSDAVHGGVALDYRLSESLQWVGEVFAERDVEGGGELAAIFSAGFRWRLAESLVADVAAGSRIWGDDAPDFTATAGLTWAFGFAGRERKQ
jgi:hypothetical protein